MNNKTKPPLYTSLTSTAAAAEAGLTTSAEAGLGSSSMTKASTGKERERPVGDLKVILSVGGLSR